MKDKIQKQTETLSNQVDLLEKLSKEGDTEKYLKELEKYNLMLKGADFSIESQAASKKKERTIADKVFAKPIRKMAREINKINKKLEAHNRK